MSILDNILGGNNSSGDNSSQQSSSSHDFNSVVGTDPSFGTSLHDLLSSHDSSQDNGGSNGGNGGEYGGGSDSSDFTGLGSLATHFSAPTVVGISSSNDQSNASENHGGDHGGLLGGLM